MKHLVRLPSLILLLSAISGANAATISLLPTSASAIPSEMLAFDLSIDFTGDPTVGGGIDISFDTGLLSFQSFSTASSTLTLDASFTRSPDPVSTGLEGLAFGSFSGLETGIVGTLTFQALAEGNSALAMAVTSDPLKGGDFISATSGEVQSVTFVETQVEISAVPLPAAVWLFGSGLIGLAGIARRRSA